MQTLFVALLVLAAIMLPGASGRRSRPEPEAPRTFRVATFNIHKGADRRGRYDLARTIDAIWRLDADFVGVQEALRNHAGFNCDDQPALIAEGLRRRTGRPWAHAYAKAWITENRQCLERRQGDGVETEGIAFFTPERIVASSSVRLSDGRVGLAVRVASLPRVPVIVTHLAATRQSQRARVREIAALLPWAASAAGPADSGLEIGPALGEPGGNRRGLVRDGAVRLDEDEEHVGAPLRPTSASAGTNPARQLVKRCPVTREVKALILGRGRGSHQATRPRQRRPPMSPERQRK